VHSGAGRIAVLCAGIALFGCSGTSGDSSDADAPDDVAENDVPDGEDAAPPGDDGAIPDAWDADVGEEDAPAPRCGDGIVQGSEECDDGNDSNADACLNDCVRARCGDGFLREGVEECEEDEGCVTSCGTAGSRRCVGCVLSPICTPPPERCNDVDDDCDGAVDDGIWCWANPLPQGNSLYDVWAAGPDDYWLVGACGTVLRGGSGGWSFIDTPTRALLRAAWGAGSDDVWAVGAQSTVLRCGGHGCASFPGPTPAVDLRSIHGRSADEVWVVGNADSIGCVYRWDGASWSPLPFPGASYPYDVWAFGPDDVWVAASSSDGLFHWNGVSWTTFSLSDRPDPWGVRALWGVAPDDLWAVGGSIAAHWDGTSWTTSLTLASEHFASIGGSAGDDVWALVGTWGGARIVRWDGVSWTDVHGLPAGQEYGALGVASPEELCVVGGGGAIMRREGAVWVDDLRGFRVDLRAIDGAAADDVWAVGLGETVLRWDGTGWNVVRERSAYGEYRGVWISPTTDDVWAGGGVTLSRFDGTAWHDYWTASPGNVQAVWGSRPDDVWAVTDRGSVLRWNGSTWAEATSSSGTSFRDVWGQSSNDVWVVGGTLLRWNGSTWTEGPSPTPARIEGVWGSGGAGVWVVASSTAHRWNGSRWEDSYLPFYLGIDVRGTTADDVWVAGDEGAARWNATYRRWETSETPACGGFAAVWASTTGEQWVVGRDGRILRRRR
jgi:cysteine-rich repeat protein